MVKLQRGILLIGKAMLEQHTQLFTMIMACQVPMVYGNMEIRLLTIAVAIRFCAYTGFESRFVQPAWMYANLYDYAKNVMMANHGHEIANHSSSHACAVERGWEPCTFSDGESGWGEAPLGADLDREINKAHNSIITGTGFVPKYYVYPYDNFTNATNQRLEDLGYLGSRTGEFSFIGRLLGRISQRRV